MNSDPEKLFTTAQNFALLREKLGEYKRLPSEKEVRQFLDFLDEIYHIWKTKNPQPDLENLEQKASARREFVSKLGIRSDEI
jgi:hypothetical protein